MPVPFDRIFADVRKDIPSLTNAVLQQEMFRVLDDFTQHTNIWQEEVAVPVQAGKSTYDLTVSKGKINRLMFVYDANSPSKNWPASGITMRVPGKLVLYRAPSQNASWIAVLAKRIYEPTTVDTNYPDIDDWIVEKYADTIGRGVLARLQLEQQKPYSNPMLAVQNQRAYISGRSIARANDGNTNVYNAQNWRYPQGWATTQRKGFV